MIDYSKGKIYAVKNNETDAIYIGSTTMELSDRFKRHQCDVKCDLFKYVKICNNGDWSKYNIELLQNAECKDIKELKKLQEAKINELKNSDDTKINKIIEYIKEEESIATGLMMLRKKYLNITIK